jgi:hypothetical protein
MTLARDHGIRYADLKDVLDHVSVTASVPVFFVFMVPGQEMFISYQPQHYLTKSGGVFQHPNTIVSNLRQFVVELDFIARQ